MISGMYILGHLINRCPFKVIFLNIVQLKSRFSIICAPCRKRGGVREEDKAPYGPVLQE